MNAMSGGNKGNKAGGKGKGGPSFSARGFTSKDPDNVARNREGASRYASKSDRIASSNRDGNADKAAARAAERANRPARAPVAKVAAPVVAAPKPKMVATKPPAGYRPGVDPEFNYSTGTAATTPRPAMAPRPTTAPMAAPRVRVQPTITLAKGGKAPRKKK